MQFATPCATMADRLQTSFCARDFVLHDDDRDSVVDDYTWQVWKSLRKQSDTSGRVRISMIAVLSGMSHGSTNDIRGAIAWLIRGGWVSRIPGTRDGEVYYQMKPSIR